MKNYIVLTVTFIVLNFNIALYSNGLLKNQIKQVKIFNTQNDQIGMQSLIVGKVNSFASKIKIANSEVLNKSQEKSKITVRLFDNKGIKSGDILYIIDEKNLIISKLKVNSIFKSHSFGYLLIGFGNFRLSSIGDRVVQKIEDNQSKFSYIHKARGDYYVNINNYGDAIKEYKNSLQLDKSNPSTHYALGNVYLKKGILLFALKEYQEAYKEISRIYDNEDKFNLLKNLAEIRYHQVYETYLNFKTKVKFRIEGINYCKEALAINSLSIEVNFILGYFYLKSPEDDDKLARDQFLKVLDLNPNHIDSLSYLAELYFNHNNPQKALAFAKKAIKSDPLNRRAKKIINQLNINN